MTKITIEKIAIKDTIIIVRVRTVLRLNYVLPIIIVLIVNKLDKYKTPLLIFNYLFFNNIHFNFSKVLFFFYSIF